MPKPNATFTPLIVANWKMQLDAAATVAWIKAWRSELKNFRGRVQPVVCPSFPALGAAAQALKGSKTKLGAQNLFWDEKGAYTGEVSPLQLREYGVEYVIVGHSERRQLLGETDVMVARKMIAAITHGLMPILCVGETANERAEGRTDLVVQSQLQHALRSMPPVAAGRHLCIAYEPVWAISPGGPATPEQTLDMKEFIHQQLVNLYGSELAERSFRIIYGGSVKAANVSDFVSRAGFSGALVGAASLQPESFASIIRAVNNSYEKS